MVSGEGNVLIVSIRPWLLEPVKNVSTSDTHRNNIDESESSVFIHVETRWSSVSESVRFVVRNNYFAVNVSKRRTRRQMVWFVCVCHIRSTETYLTRSKPTKNCLGTENVIVDLVASTSDDETQNDITLFTSPGPFKSDEHYSTSSRRRGTFYAANEGRITGANVLRRTESWYHDDQKLNTREKRSPRRYLFPHVISIVV